MIPSWFEFIEAILRLPSGKVDRRSLPGVSGSLPYTTQTTSLAPRTPLELQLANIWEQTLDVHPIGIRDDFFELGGHSLLAVRLLAKIAEISGRNLPTATLLQAPTIEQLAQVLSQEGWTPHSLVPVQPEGSKPPLFFVPGHLGGGLGFRHLAEELGTDQPFYVLAPLGYVGTQNGNSLINIEAMSAHFIEELRAVQRDGPYYLGGYCMGGVAAFEMARQLHAMDEHVAMVAILNTWYVTPGSFLVSLAQLVDLKLRNYWSNRSRLASAKRLTQILAKVQKRINNTVRSKLFRGKRLLHRSKQMDSGSAAYEGPRLAYRRYTPRLYPGRLNLFLAEEESPLLLRHDCRLDWKRVAAGGQDVEVVPGDHNNMLQPPNVRVLAEKLQKCMNKASVVDSL